MKHFISLFIILLLGGRCFAQNDQLEWTSSFGGLGYEYGRQIDTDSSGNVYSTGIFEGIVDFDPGAGVLNLVSIGSSDIYIQKLDDQGNFLWAKSLGGALWDNSNSIHIDFNDNVYITGSFQGIVDFDPGVGVYNLNSWGRSVSFILKLDSLGDFLWAKNLIGSGNTPSYITIQELKTDLLGNVYTTGMYRVSVDFDPGPGVALLTTAINGRSCFVLKLDSLGSYIWAKSTDGGGIAGLSLSLFGGDVFVTGWFMGTVDFDPGIGITSISAHAVFTDVFILKLNNLGNFSWVKTLKSTAESTTANEITHDRKGNIFLTGDFRGTTDFDPGTGLVSHMTNGWGDIYILKLDPSGNFLWVRCMGNVLFGAGNSITTDSIGNSYTLGRYRGTINFSSAITNILPLPSGHSATSGFVLKLSPLGNFLWALPITGTAGVFSHSITKSKTCGVYATGYFSGKLGVIGNYTNVSNGQNDSFILKICQGLDSKTQVISDSLLCPLDSVQFSLSHLSCVDSLGWSFGDTNSGILNYSGDLEPYHIYNSSGNYPIEVLVYSSCSIDTVFDTIYVTPLPIVNLGNDTVLCEGDSLHLQFNDTTNSYLWGNGDTSMQIQILQAATYTLAVTGICGTGYDTIVVDSLIPALVHLPPDSLLCDNDSLLLGASIQSGMYIWSTGSSDSAIWVSVADTFWVTASNFCGTSTDTIITTYTHPPSFDLGMDTTLCIGDILVLNAYDTLSDYIWSTNSTSPLLTIVASGVYSVTTTNVCGVFSDTIQALFLTVPLVDLGGDKVMCKGDSVPLFDTFLHGSYLWSDLSTLDTLWVSSPGIYQLTVTNICGVTSDTIMVHEDNSPVTNLGPDSTYCFSTLIDLNAYWSRASYLWNTSETTANITANYSGNYSVQVINLCGYDGDTVNIQYDIPIQFNLGPDTLLCVGDSFLLSAPAHNANWTWSSGALDSMLMVNSPGTYSVTATNICGNFSDVISVRTETVPVIDPAIADTAFCEGSRYTVDVNKNNATSILWLNGHTNYQLEFDAKGEYSYELINACGSTRDTFEIELYSLADANLGSETIICYGEQIVKSFQYPDHTYSWYDGSTDSVRYINEPGIYGVTIFTPVGCESYGELIVTICEGQLYIPNAFTPNNGDALNNSFTIIGQEIRAFTIVIYDRWGMEIFQSEDLSYSWDGTINGQQAASGVYSYKVWYNTGRSSKSITKYGMVNLIR